MDKISQLNGYEYYWKNKEKRGDRLQYGVMAQEVAAIVPDMVRPNGSNELTVSYSSLVPVLIEATKEQQKLIEEKDEKLNHFLRR